MLALAQQYQVVKNFLKHLNHAKRQNRETADIAANNIEAETDQLLAQL